MKKRMEGRFKAAGDGCLRKGRRGKRRRRRRKGRAIGGDGGSVNEGGDVLVMLLPVTGRICGGKK